MEKEQIVAVSKNGLTFTEKEMQKYVIPFNKLRIEKHPFSWHAIKYKINEMILRILDKIQPVEVQER